MLNIDESAYNPSSRMLLSPSGETEQLEAMLFGKYSRHREFLLSFPKRGDRGAALIVNVFLQKFDLDIPGILSFFLSIY